MGLRASSVVRAAPATSPIQHIVVIDQENHSFDNVLGAFCAQVDGGQILHDPCDGATTGVLPSGRVIPLSQAADLVPNIAHGVSSQAKAINNGAMNGFAKISGCGAATGYACYSQFDPTQIPNVEAVAQQFALSDRTFEFSDTPSWGGHLILASATLDGFSGDNPTKGPQFGPGWGCDSYHLARWWDGTQYILVPSCIPDINGNGPFEPSPVLYVPTIFDELDAAGLAWKIYGGNGLSHGPGNGYRWTICPTFYECLGGPQGSHLVAADQVMTDAAAGTLPSFSIVTPEDFNSQHNGESMATGDNWLGQVLGALMASPEFSSTAIFLTWDDCGCFYDHVPPPVTGWGIRVPMIIISPYAKPGYTDSTNANYLSLLAYTEHTFGLAPLTSDDASAYDYSGAFNYAQPPTPFVPMVASPVARSELRWIAAHPIDPSDPT